MCALCVALTFGIQRVPECRQIYASIGYFQYICCCFAGISWNQSFANCLLSLNIIFRTCAKRARIEANVCSKFEPDNNTLQCIYRSIFRISTRKSSKKTSTEDSPRSTNSGTSNETAATDRGTSWTTFADPPSLPAHSSQQRRWSFDWSVSPLCRRRSLSSA